MSEINTQSILFTASGLLSAAVAPGTGPFAKMPTADGGLTDQPTIKRKIRIQGIHVSKVGAGGNAQVFDSADNNPADPSTEVYGSDSNDSITNLGVNIKSGDVFVRITGGYKLWLYVDLNS